MSHHQNYWRAIATAARFPICLIVLLLAVIATPVQARTAGDIVSALERHVGGLAETHDFSGVVLLARGDEILFERAYGPANRSFAVPNRTDTRFGIASMNKMFTALAIIRLFDERGLSLQTPLIEVLPDYPNSAVARRVTIEQLLTHTSGVGNYWAGLSRHPITDFTELADYLPLFADQELSFEPGSAFGYSNGGYVILGLVIEKMTGERYRDHVERTIFAPLGMTGTGSPRLDMATANRAIGYTRSLDLPGEWANNLFVGELRGSSAGGGVSTARDLLRFSNALTENRLLPADRTAAYTMGRHDYPKGRYGYGFSEDIVNGHRIIGHTGGHIGTAAELKIFTDLGYTFVILSNGDVDAYWSIENFVTELLAGENPASINYRYTEALIDRIVEDGTEAALAWNAAQPENVAARESVIEVASFRYLHRGMNDTAIALLSFNTSAFPESSSAEYYLGEAHRVLGNRSEAIAAYRRYLTAFPGDEDTLGRLREIGAADPL
ncbi:serine hydrolase [Parasphingopyxis lamellibrachiae]|uniref:CubicO group peptidase (Beta-lactamase class C family) n=1 Tax=Parasphingopyxis lamellibrachiae TaxID=680125 RepID=A0A3D9FDH2_9SPHN|nr:serine hydrolase [Parasphingopyxis lamellibrachiae]RED15116.1 CubicO group peptidase (beta-lactamase class C family) [Parasphingopyxis lamellibrachiae]